MNFNDLNMLIFLINSSRHGKPSNKSYSPEAKKANHDNAKSGSATRDELR